jgi:HTH-type transcriptional regulator/antitoxin HipB
MLLLSVRDARSLARARRLELGLTQGDVARRAGTSRQWIVGFENGGSGTDLALVLRLFAALDLTLDARPGRAERPAGMVDLDRHLRQLAEGGASGRARASLRHLLIDHGGIAWPIEGDPHGGHPSQP